jgi:hypothetical protein
LRLRPEWWHQKRCWTAVAAAYCHRNCLS